MFFFIDHLTQYSQIRLCCRMSGDARSTSPCVGAVCAGIATLAHLVMIVYNAIWIGTENGMYLYSVLA